MRNRDRLRPLQPIYDPEVRRGAMAVGNTPGTVVTPATLYRTRVGVGVDASGQVACDAAGDYAYVGTSTGFAIVDLSELPSSLSYVGAVDDGITGSSGTRAVAVDGNWLYWYGATSGSVEHMKVYDITNRESPVEEFAQNGGVDANYANFASPNMLISGDTLYIGGSVYVGSFDITTRDSPSFLDRYTHGSAHQMKLVSIAGSQLLAGGGGFALLTSLDVSNPSSISAVETVSTITLDRCTHAEAGTVSPVARVRTSQLQVFTVDGASDIIVRDSESFSGVGNAQACYVTGTAVTVYHNGDITTYDITDPDAISLIASEEATDLALALAGTPLKVPGLDIAVFGDSGGFVYACGFAS